MIGIGVAAVQRFRPVLLAFAVILVVSAYKMLNEGDDDEGKHARIHTTRTLLLSHAPLLLSHSSSPTLLLSHAPLPSDLKDNMVMRIARRLVDAQDEYDGTRRSAHHFAASAAARCSLLAARC